MKNFQAFLEQLQSFVKFRADEKCTSLFLVLSLITKWVDGSEGVVYFSDFGVYKHSVNPF